MRPRQAVRMRQVNPEAMLIPVEAFDAGEEREVPGWDCDCEPKDPINRRVQSTKRATSEPRSVNGIDSWPEIPAPRWDHTYVRDLRPNQRIVLQQRVYDRGIEARKKVALIEALSKQVWNRKIFGSNDLRHGVRRHYVGDEEPGSPGSQVFDQQPNVAAPDVLDEIQIAWMFLADCDS